MIISDFYDQEGFFRGVDLLRHRRFESHLIQIYANEEANPTWLGDMELEEAETGQLRKITISERKLRQYKILFDEFLASIDKYCRTYSISATRTTTDVPFDELILRMMRAAELTSS